MLAGVPTSAARPGETIMMYGTGFGRTLPDMPSGLLITTPAPLVNPVSVRMGARPADVRWQGISGAGLWQLNVVVPSDLPDGDVEVIAEAGGARSQSGVYITVQR
jgi:uncharacterized protein (TIGR03437 family)